MLCTCNCDSVLLTILCTLVYCVDPKVFLRYLSVHVLRRCLARARGIFLYLQDLLTFLRQQVRMRFTAINIKKPVVIGCIFYLSCRPRQHTGFSSSAAIFLQGNAIKKKLCMCSLSLLVSSSHHIDG